MGVHLFVDESRRGRVYLLAAAVVAPTRLHQARALMRNLCMPGERRVHFQAERDSRRRKIIAELVANQVCARVYVGVGPADQVRAAGLGLLLRDAIGLGAHRLVIESRGPAADRTDRATIHRVLRDTASSKLVYEHLCPHEDPALAIPDAVAWAYGAGADWRRRIMPAVEWVVDLGAVSTTPRQREARAPVVRRVLPGLTSSA